LLAYETVLEVREPGTFFVMAFSEEHVPEAEFLGTSFQVRHDGWVGPAAGALAKLGRVDRVGWEAFFIHEFFHLNMLINIGK
jgi:hypothetical protein